MKKQFQNYLFKSSILFNLLYSIISFAIDFPILNERVYDEARLINPDKKQELINFLEKFEKKTTVQFVIASFQSLQNQTIEDFGYQLGRFWRIGQKDVNNGVILIIAPNENSVRIEVGYGLEGLLTDAICSKIINGIILPNFRKKEYQKGIIEAVNYISNVLENKNIDLVLKLPDNKVLSTNNNINQSENQPNKISYKAFVKNNRKGTKLENLIFYIILIIFILFLITIILATLYIIKLLLNKFLISRITNWEKI